MIWKKNLGKKLAKIYNSIANKLNEMIPAEWDCIYLLGEVEKGQLSYRATFYFSEPGKSEFIRCFSIPDKYNVPEDIYDQYHDELSDLVFELNNCFKRNNQELWDQFTFSVDKNGKFNSEYKYDAMDEKNGSEIRREVIWAYEMFGYTPKGSNHLKKILDEYLAEKVNT